MQANFSNYHYMQPQVGQQYMQGNNQMMSPTNGAQMGGQQRQNRGNFQQNQFNQNNGNVGNRNNMMSNPVPNENGQEKKNNFEPSPVLYFGKLPLMSSQKEIEDLCAKFGTVKQIYMLSNHEEGFVQFETTEEASKCLEYYRENKYMKNGKTINFHWSGRDSITMSKIDKNEPNRILLLTISYVAYAVTPDVLQKIFANYGRLLRCVIFESKFGLQALCELEDEKVAQVAKESLNGKNIYSGCNLLTVQYSSMKELKISENNERSRDFTRDLPAYKSNPSQNSGNFMNEGVIHNMPNGMRGMPNGMQQPGNMNQMMMYGIYSGMNPNQVDNAHNCVLLVSRFPETTTPDMLFKVFGLYGNVMRVKIFYKKRDQGLVQFELPEDAALARQCLDGCPFFGTNLKVTMSKQGPIKLPRPNDTEGHLFNKDYSDSREHRFAKGSGRRGPRNVPPCDTLHVANLDGIVSQEHLKEALGEVAAIIGFRFFDQNEKVAFAKFSSVDQAVSVLVLCHNKKVNGRFIKLSFARNNV
eukprot:CAMPEP_0115026552 /NCGR_PEP_ID=MMETSP0216-20121206/34831_1 /TAXON_ID=223996 /ORGANISM="Protocruzia adherens, Strain Boccale" /LENGTH=526 /DNA_ID=CAMNT_0002401683 /DNA_START=30 /DNA_END=1610 /DNA_ORIENTATION=-